MKCSLEAPGTSVYPEIFSTLCLMSLIVKTHIHKEEISNAILSNMFFFSILCWLMKWIQTKEQTSISIYLISTQNSTIKTLDVKSNYQMKRLSNEWFYKSFSIDDSSNKSSIPSRKDSQKWRREWRDCSANVHQ
jgi:hypothetical protein